MTVYYIKWNYDFSREIGIPDNFDGMIFFFECSDCEKQWNVYILWITMVYLNVFRFQAQSLKM